MAIISFILVFLLIVLLMLLLCTITIRIEELDLSNCNYKSKLEYDFEIYFELYVLNKLKILSIKMIYFDKQYQPECLKSLYTDFTRILLPSVFACVSMDSTSVARISSGA